MRSRISFSIVDSRHANPDTAAPMKSPQIIPTVNAYRPTTPSSSVRENSPVTNSGDMTDIIHANIPPSTDESKEPISTIRKNPTAVLIMYK